MPIEIIVALSNLKTVGRGLKKNLGDAKGTLPSPFFFLWLFILSICSAFCYPAS